MTRNYQYTIRRLLFGILIVAATLAVFVGPVQRAREASRRAECMNHLKLLTMAWMNYESARGRYPARTAADERLSWRAIVPYYMCMEYRQIDPNAPWNSPNNARFSIPPTDGLQCCNREDASSPFIQVFAVSAPSSLWRNAPISRKDVTDKRSDTLVLIELDLDRVHWMSPTDVTLDELIEMLRQNGRLPSPHPGGAIMSFADGSVKFVPHELITPELLRAIVSIDGDERLGARLENLEDAR